MRKIRVVAIVAAAVAAVLVSGCMAAPISSAIFVGVMAADTVNYYTIGPDGKTPIYLAPDPDPTRKINEQDCTKPMELNGGNLRCKAPGKEQGK